ncbi:MAG: celA [Chthoniobacteraceae bacterium]|nr:celA [Chthoniobacteraceae bacterium]
MKHLIAFLLFAATILQDSSAVAQTASLLANGDFESVKDDARPDNWALGADMKWEKEGGNHFLRLTSPKPGANVMAYRSVELKPDMKALELRYKVRFEKIQRGKQTWFDGRIIINFKDAAKHTLAPSPNPAVFVGTAKDWKEKAQQFKVPNGATTIELMFTLFQPESGQLDFDDISLTSISADTVESATVAAGAKETARIAALAKPQPQVPAPSPDQLPQPLQVAGNRLQTPAGKTVRLQGLAVASMEWAAGGEHILKSIETGLTDWKANCIRLCLRDDFWAGKGPYQNDGGMGYRQLVEDAINACASHGAYIVLDLHDYRAPREKHAAFWQDVATRYKNHPAVIFELLNEPHDIPWEVWRNGGPVTDKKKNTDALAENQQTLVSYQSIGMQKLVEVIRSTGAKNLIIAGGLDWGYDLSGILNGFALDDLGGNGIMYSSHVYPWKSDWPGKFLAVAGKYPVFIGEVGADTQPMAFIPTERQENPATWVPDMLGIIQKYELNWTAWCFHPTATPRVILDWNYTPTPFWGVFVKQALAGQTFENKRLR